MYRTKCCGVEPDQADCEECDGLGLVDKGKEYGQPCPECDGTGLSDVYYECAECGDTIHLSDLDHE